MGSSHLMCYWQGASIESDKYPLPERYIYLFIKQSIEMLKQKSHSSAFLQIGACVGLLTGAWNGLYTAKLLLGSKKKVFLGLLKSIDVTN